MKIEFPYIKDILPADEEVAYNLIESLYYRYLNNLGSTSLPFWLDKFSTNRQGTRICMALALEGIITTSVPKSNWAEVAINEAYLLAQYSREELDQMRRDTKLARYKPLEELPQSLIAGACRVSLPSGVKPSGIVRLGFAKCAQHTFSYDIALMVKYYDLVVANAAKSMRKLEEKLKRKLVIEQGYDYESTIKAVIDFIIAHDGTFTLGELTNDSRGRAIFQCLTTVFNPIASKYARALVKAPAVVVKDASELDDTYLFIAELVSGFDGDIDRKLANGKLYFANRTFPSFDLATESGVDDFFEHIWLERIYHDLEFYQLNPNHRFTTPIEVDFSSSNMVMIGLLLGHSDYVDHTQYMWQVDGLSKLHVKKAQTPYVFGSSASVVQLWKKAHLAYTADQVLRMRQEQASGKFAIANELKDIIINHCQPTATMKLHVLDEHYNVECNRYKYVGDTTKQYVVYDSTKDTMRVITHTSTHKVPDLKQFRRYFSTGLI